MSPPHFVQLLQIAAALLALSQSVSLGWNFRRYNAASLEFFALEFGPFRLDDGKHFVLFTRFIVDGVFPDDCIVT